VVTARGTEAREQYERMRHIAFTSLPKGDFSPQTTIKVIMEFVASDELVTLACSVIGDASVYMSSGAFVIGGYSQPGVAKLARDFVKLGDLIIRDGERTEATHYPSQGRTQLFSISPRGLYRVERYSGSSHSEIERAGHSIIVELGKYPARSASGDDANA